MFHEAVEAYFEANNKTELSFAVGNEQTAEMVTACRRAL